MTAHVFLASVGCKLNQSEVDNWSRRLAASGCEVVADPGDADLCVVNTCTVTHVAAHKSRQLLRRCHRANPRAEAVVTGCYAEISPLEAAQLPGVSLVVGTAAKEHLVETIIERLGLPALPQPASISRMARQHTRAFVKIQDGCDNACTYCIVRIARGHQRSRAESEILADLLARQAEGYQEVVLTGVHIGAYGRDLGSTLAELVQTVLDTTRFPRLRLTSVEPWDVSADLLDLWQDSRLCRHLHLPLQSGCDATLQRMNRRYTTVQYRKLVDRARVTILDLAVTTDLIVGFPGENEEEFAASARFVADMDFARIHVFPFSARPGTVAATMPEAIPPSVKAKRVQQMLDVARHSADSFHRRFIGRTMHVLWEDRAEGQWSGLTDNYLRIQTSSEQDLHNRILPVRLQELTADGLNGPLIE